MGRPVEAAIMVAEIALATSPAVFDNSWCLVTTLRYRVARSDEPRSRCVSSKAPLLAKTSGQGIAGKQMLT
jgi:hypothetical protein